MTESWEDDDCYYISFGVGRSRRYHTKMRAFYQGCHDFVLALNAVAGTGAFVALIGGKEAGLTKALIGIVAVASAIDTVWGFSRKAKVHDDLARRFTELAARMVEKKPTPENYRWACAERLRIEKDEPPVKRLVDLVAQNEEQRARGVPEKDMVPLGVFQPWLGYVFTYGLSRLDKRIAKQQDRRELDAQKTQMSTDRSEPTPIV